MGEWMSILEITSPFMRKMPTRRTHTCRPYGGRRGIACCSEMVLCAKGDAANLAEIEGIDFDVVNKDLIDYYYECEDR